LSTIDAAEQSAIKDSIRAANCKAFNTAYYSSFHSTFAPPIVAAIKSPNSETKFTTLSPTFTASISATYDATNITSLYTTVSLSINSAKQSSIVSTYWPAFCKAKQGTIESPITFSNK
jgi:hypothetical protein